MISYSLCKHFSVYMMKGSFCHRLNLYPFPPTSYFTSLCFPLPHLILLAAIVCLLSPQLCFLPNFHCFCLLSLFPLPRLLLLCFLLQHPPSEHICSAEFHRVWIQPWHKAVCDLVASNLPLNHNETLSQTKFHHMRGISCMEIIFLDEKGISPVATPPGHPILCRTPNCIYFSIRECQPGHSGEGRSSANNW